MTTWAIAGITTSPQFLESPETAKYQAGPSVSAPFDWPDIGGVKRQETKIYEKRRFIPSVRSKTSGVCYCLAASCFYAPTKSDLYMALLSKPIENSAFRRSKIP